MTTRIAQFVRSHNDVVDADFLRDFPGVEAIKADNLVDFAQALDGAEILHVYNSAYTPEFAQLVAEKGGALKWMQFTTVGIDIADESGLPDTVWITNTGDVSQKILAGHAMALMLAVMRGLHLFEPHRARHSWSREEMQTEVVSPDGGTLVILGMGRIAQNAARMARAFDMEVVCVTRADAPAVPEIDRVVPRERVEEALPQADVVMVCMPIDDGTEGFLTADRIALMKESAVLVNISRGLVVDEAALADALRHNRIRGAALDAFGEEPLPPDSPFWDLPNVVMTPHIGGQGGGDQWRRLSDMIRENTRRYLAGETLQHVVRKPAATD
jgi:phosphoglycerate dehydrogenase-like enzyme